MAYLPMRSANFGTSTAVKTATTAAKSAGKVARTAVLSVL
jgi:hypothetical protein